MNKCLVPVLSVLLFFSSQLYGQNESRNSLLWEISGKNLKKPSYIFGTMHLLCEEDAPIGDSLQYAIEKADIIYFEIDMNDVFQMLSMVRYLNMKNGLTLEDLYSQDEYKKLLEGLQKMKLPLPFSMLKKMKPIFLTGLLSETLFDCPKKKGMEELILKESKKYHTPIKGLESVAYQAGLFDSIPYPLQAKELLNYIDSLEVIKVQTLNLVELYKKQELEEVGRLSIQTDPGMEKFIDLLLYRRNKNWSEKFEEISKEKSCLISVGAGHLPGENGLLELLRKRGYRVRSVENKKKKGAYLTIVPLEESD